MTLSGLTLHWTPATPATANVVLLADDGRGGHTQQSFTITVYAGGTPDLEITEIDTSMLTTDLATLVTTGSVFVTVKNLGGGLVETAFDVLMFRDQNKNGAYNVGPDVELGAGRYAGSLTSQSEAIVEVPISAVFAYADEVIYAFVDSSAEIAESDETNNVSETGIDSLYAPPLGVDSPTVKWYAALAGGVQGPPLVAPLIDTNGDHVIDDRDVPAIVVVAQHPDAPNNYAITALRGDTGAIIFRTTSTVSVDPNMTPAIGDLDGDGKPEIVARNYASNRVSAFNNAGHGFWPSSVSASSSINQPVIADLDGDGKAEVIVAGGVINFNGTVRYSASNGFPLTDQSAIGGQDNSSSHQVVDLDRDGSPEIIASASAYDKDGRRIWAWGTFLNNSGTGWIARGSVDRGATSLQQDVPGPFGDSWTAVANIDADPFPEVLATTYQESKNLLWIFGRDGRIKDTRLIFQDVPLQLDYTLGPVTLADLDGDGTPEIVVAAGRTGATSNLPNTIVLSAYRANGTLYWQREMSPGALIVNGVPLATAFDFDGDGAYELVYQDTAARLDSERPQRLDAVRDRSERRESCGHWLRHHRGCGSRRAGGSDRSVAQRSRLRLAAAQRRHGHQRYARQLARRTCRVEPVPVSGHQRRR